MRISAFLLFIGILQVFANDSYSQITRLTLSMSDATVQQVLAEIESQSEFYILFNHQLVDVNRKVNIEVTNKRINNILTALFKSTDVEYFVMGRQIILSPKDILYEGVAGIKRTQKAIDVKGTVVDENGNPLPGVNIIIKGTSQGSISDANGKYTIHIEDPNTILVFSFIGMLTQEIQVGNQTEINITLDRDAVGLEEVIAIGYGTQGIRKVTSSIYNLKTEGLKDIPIVASGDLMKGRIAGVSVTTPDGEPGTIPVIRIRGVSSVGAGDNPLIVIDGFPVGKDLKNANEQKESGYSHNPEYFNEKAVITYVSF